MHLVVIGGAGFIGTRLCHRLSASQASFSIVDKRHSAAYPDRSHIADVRSMEALRAGIPDGAVIFNLAAEHRDDVSPRSLYDEVNVGGARNICRVARERGVNKIIFTSSVAVYGFADIGTDETGEIRPFNDYGRTKGEAEAIFKAWQEEAPECRTLTIVRPTVVFGEDNRGNVYNLLRQIATNRFMMVGSGENRKSMAYVENVAAFLEYATRFAPGIHVFNFVDKPDFTMNALVKTIRSALGGEERVGLRLPYAAGYGIGMMFDVAGGLTGRKFPISRVRIKKFCSNSVYASAVEQTGFISPVPLAVALANTVRHEFIAPPANAHLFFSE